MRARLLLLSAALLLIPLLLVPGYLSAQTSATPTCAPSGALDSIRAVLAASTDDAAALGELMQARSLIDAQLSQCKTQVATLTAQTRIAGVTQTRQALNDARTSTAAAIQATWTQIASDRLSTLDAIHQTQTAIGPTGNNAGVVPVVSSGGQAAPTVAPQPTVNANGPTALCVDGTYSYAKTHQGACSHHGGVKVWYK